MTPMAGGALRVETRESALRAEVLESKWTTHSEIELYQLVCNPIDTAIKACIMSYQRESEGSARPSVHVARAQVDSQYPTRCG